MPQSMMEKESSYSESEEEYGPQIPKNIMKKISGLPDIKKSESDSPDTYGPALPHHLQKSNTQVNKNTTEEEEEDDDDNAYGPSLPPHLLRSRAGPGERRSGALVSLHAGTRASSSVVRPQTSNNESESNISDSDEYGPSLPPHLRNSAKSQTSKAVVENSGSESGHLKYGKENERTCGPVLPSQSMAISVMSDEDEDSYCPDLPPHLKMKQSSNSNFDSNPREEATSTVEIPEDDESSEDGEVYGPMPPTQEVDLDDYIESTLHQRTEATQRRLQNANSTAPRREDWMLTLPEDRPLFSGLGLQARQFSKSGKRDRGDTSVWTDTPADKERKAQRAAEGRCPEKRDEAAEVRTSSRDERLQVAVARHNEAKRSRPLIEEHQSKQKKAKKDGLSVTGVGVDRKPFSREEDLHVNKFDEAQKSSILKKARDLNDRFSSGKSSKFL